MAFQTLAYIVLPRQLVKMQIAQFYDLVGLEWGPSTFTSSKSPGDMDAAVRGPHLRYTDLPETLGAWV
jgi:hypothetical protein